MTKIKGKIEFDREAFKKAIAQVESSGGKYLENTSSSAAGRYHFLYRYIKGVPLLKGVSKREFINRPELQEKVMDMAIDGDLPGFPSYKDHALSLKKRFGSNMDIHHIAALTHFLGKGGVTKYMSNPDGFVVPGKNASVNQYIKRFQDSFVPVKGTKIDIIGGKDIAKQIAIKERGETAIDNTAVAKPKTIRTEEFTFKDSGKEFINFLNEEDEELFDEKPTAKEEPPKEEPILKSDYKPETSELESLAKLIPSTGEKNITESISFLNEFAMGGQISSHGADDIIPIENGGTHEENPYGGVPMGIGANGKMNTVEEGEVKFGDYVFSNRLSLGGKITSNSGVNSYAEGGSLSNSSCGGPGQPPCDENYYETIRNSRQGHVRKNVDGESTHLMADNNKDKAFPTLFRNKDGSWDDFSGDHDAAFNRATTDNEIYSFDNQNELFKFAREGSWKNKSNKFANGGNLTDPTDPPAEAGKNVLSFLDNEYLPTPQPQERKKALEVYKNLPLPLSIMEENDLTIEKSTIEDQREKYMKNDPGYGVLRDGGTRSVDFDSLITDDIHERIDGKPTKSKRGHGEARQFLDRYNDPITRERMKNQIGVTDEDIDNMIIRGLQAEKHAGGNKAGTGADMWTSPLTGKDQIFVSKNRLEDKSLETHERAHASKMDDEMGVVLQKVLGSAFDQKRTNSRDGGYVPRSTKSYLDRPGETYGNFAGFREQLGLKPGEQIDIPTMKKLIKDKKIETNFDNVFDDDKIVKALNTIAYQDSNNNQEYRIS